MLVASRKSLVRLPLLSAAAISGLLWSDAVRASDLIEPDMPTATAPPRSRIDAAWNLMHDWHVVVGAGASFEPEYEGGDKFTVSPLPYISIQPYDWLTLDPTGISVRAYEIGPASFDLKVGYDTGRSEGDADMLRGMGDIDFGATVGGTATYSFGPADFFLEAEKTIGGSDGLTATAGVSVTHKLTDSLILGGEASLTVADENYMQAYFGVDAMQSSRSGHAQYNAGAGLKSVGVSASATYLINENWFVKGEQSVDFLMGDAADSPIVERKFVSKSMLVLGYQF